MEKEGMSEVVWERKKRLVQKQEECEGICVCVYKFSTQNGVCLIAVWAVCKQHSISLMNTALTRALIQLAQNKRQKGGAVVWERCTQDSKFISSLCRLPTKNTEEHRHKLTLLCYSISLYYVILCPCVCVCICVYICHISSGAADTHMKPRRWKACRLLCYPLQQHQRRGALPFKHLGPQVPCSACLHRKARGCSQTCRPILF